jgi:tRNA dimethylallyltransferase
VALVGPTASGKTGLAIELASRLGAEILSVDSMQVYRSMDIGTAKPTVDERRGIVHHMIDVVDPGAEFSVAEFRSMARAALEETKAPAVVITGGSGLHFRAVVDPLRFPPTEPELRTELESSDPSDLVDELVMADSDAGQYVDLNNPRRVLRAVEILRLTGATPAQRVDTEEAKAVRDYAPEIEFTGLGVDPGPGLDERIDARIEEMVEAGLVEEVVGLAGRLSRTARAAVGYREILDCLESGRDPAEGLAGIPAATRKLADRQRTWFQRDPRISWIPWSDRASARLDAVLELL